MEKEKSFNKVPNYVRGIRDNINHVWRFYAVFAEVQCAIPNRLSRVLVMCGRRVWKTGAVDLTSHPFKFELTGNRPFVLR